MADAGKDELRQELRTFVSREQHKALFAEQQLGVLQRLSRNEQLTAAETINLMDWLKPEPLRDVVRCLILSGEDAVS